MIHPQKYLFTMETKKRDKLADSNDLIIGMRLKYLREHRAFKSKDVARDLGMNETLYIKYENSYSMPSGRVIRKFAEYYDVSADFILGLVSFPIPIYRQSGKE